MLTPTSWSRLRREEIALPELRHVREDRYVHGIPDGTELVQGPHRLREDRVRAGLDQCTGPVLCRPEAVRASDVGPRHDEEVGVAACVGGGPDALDRGVEVDDVLAVEVTAPLGVELVLDVATGQACVLEFLYAAGHVHGLAEAGVCVDQAGQVRHPGDLSGPACATSVSVVRPMSGSPRSAAITAPEM